MSRAASKTLQQDLETIFSAGSLSALTDGQLVARFLEGRDRTGEQAFEAIVDRHGSMVYRVCCQVVGDGHEAEDAFQAVFLVLARRAGSVRNRESLGSWLYGVALRVAARARAGIRRRRGRELQSESGLNDLEAPGQVQSGSRYFENTELVHQEVARLPEKHRVPIVLCYLEGLTHGQAAARLNWPVGTVRSRLARGRDQLRGRLVRRGVKVPAALGPLAAWVGLEAGGMAGAGTASATAISSLPAALADVTVRRACQFAEGKSTAVALFSSTSLTLTKGVLRSMALEKMAILACTLLPAGLLVWAGIVIGHEPGAGGKPQAAASTAPAKPTSPPVATRVEEPPDPVDPLLRRLLKASRDRLEAQRSYYKEGRITLDRTVIASERLMEVERLIARKDSERVAAMQRHADRLKEMEDNERKEFEMGRSTVADVSEIAQDRLEAELRVRDAKEARPTADVAALERRLKEVERKLDQLLKKLPEQ